MREINETRYSRVQISSINQLADETPDDLIEKSETYYHNQLEEVVQSIIEGQQKVVLLSGPSASGKTTTAHKLKDRLRALDYGASVLSMDDFFKGVKFYPLLENGEPDMESIKALDLDLLNQCFEELLETGTAEFPIFDFTTQARSDESRTKTYKEHDILIMEGIHALNPMVLQNIPRKDIFRIYVSARSKFVKGEESILEPKEIRLIRRMVRDYLFRNYSPQRTIEYWEHVVNGEKINIDPYRDDVDFKMDNTIDYEVCVWRSVIAQVVGNVSADVFAQYPEMKRINDGLLEFHQMSPDKIPEDSLLREFIGKLQ